MLSKLLLLHASVVSLYFALVCPPPALAYFDLGMGTYLLQMVVGFGAVFWLSLKNNFSGKPKLPKKSEEAPGAKVQKETP